MNSQILSVRNLNCRDYILIMVVRDIWRWAVWSNFAQSMANFSFEVIFLIKLVRTTTSQALTICKDRYSTASPGNLFQHVTTYCMKKFSYYLIDTFSSASCVCSPSPFHYAPPTRVWLHLLHRLPTVCWSQKLHDKNYYFFQKSSNSNLKIDDLFYMGAFI